MKKRFLFFTNLCVIISAIIGAGFATGQELVVYFGNKSALLSAFFSGVFFFLFFCCAVIKDSTIVKNNPNSKFIIFYKIFLEVVACFSSVIVLCAMLSGIKSLLPLLYSNSNLNFALSEIIPLTCIFLVFFNKKGMQLLGIFFVPIIIILLVIISFNNEQFNLAGQVQGSIISSFFYVSLNSVFITTLISDYCRPFNTKTKFFFCFISACLCGFLLVLALGNTASCNLELALVKLAFFNKSFGVIYCIIVLFGIITTVCASAVSIVEKLDIIVNCRILSVVIVFAIAKSVSLIDFSVIVTKFYPFISILGIMVIILTIVVLFINFKSFKKKSSLPLG